MNGRVWRIETFSIKISDQSTSQYLESNEVKLDCT
jgi:hypothetical protein